MNTTKPRATTGGGYHSVTEGFLVGEVVRRVTGQSLVGRGIRQRAIFEPAVGWGGSIVMIDLDARMTVAYAMNQMFQGRGGDYRGLGIVLAACVALEG